MRLVDADVADKWMRQNNAFIDAAILKAIPTIDAVPVVRCQECRYYPIRLCNTIANDIYQQFSQNYIGVVNNNDAGRARFKAAIVGYLYQIQDAEGIQNFDPEDVEVLPGIDIDAIVVNVAFYAVDSVEKVYMSVSVS